MTMRRIIEKLCLWVLRKLSVGLVVIPESVTNILPAARSAVADVSLLEGLISGVFRNSVARGKVMKSHPTAAERDVAFAIELAIRGWR